MHIKVGQYVLVWDGKVSLPAIVTVASDVPNHMWSPPSGESLVVLSPSDADGKVSIDAALRGDYYLRSASDDMNEEMNK